MSQVRMRYGRPRGQARATRPIQLAVLSLLGLLMQASCGFWPQTPSPRSSECRIASVGHDTLTLNGHPTYIEPVAVEPDGSGRLLLLGRLNYRFRRGQEGWELHESGRNLLGVMMDRDGQPTAVAPPIQGKVFDSPRAFGSNGQWQVLLSELKTRGDSVAGDTVSALWYAEFNGTDWSRLQRIATPDVTLDSNLAASATTADGALAWAFTTRGAPSVVLVLRGTGGEWESELIPTMAAEAEVFFGSNGDLLLAALQSDTTLPRDGSSLLLRSQVRRWNVVGVLHSSARGQVNRLDVQQTGDTAILTWETRAAGIYRVHTSSIVAGLPGQAAMVDSSVITGGPLAPVRLRDAGRVWVTTHRGPEGLPLIRISTLAADSTIRPVGTIANPFVAGVGVTGRGDTLLITGAIANGRSYVASLLLSMEIRCD